MNQLNTTPFSDGGILEKNGIVYNVQTHTIQ